MKSSLPNAIDEAWRTLLKRLSDVGEDGKTPAIEYKDQIDALEAAAKWIETKTKIPAPVEEKEESKFNAIKSQFHGRAKRPSPNPFGRGGKPAIVASGGDGDAGEDDAEAVNRADAAAEAGPGDGVEEPEPVHH